MHIVGRIEFRQAQRESFTLLWSGSLWAPDIFVLLSKTLLGHHLLQLLSKRLLSHHLLQFKKSYSECKNTHI